MLLRHSFVRCFWAEKWIDSSTLDFMQKTMLLQLLHLIVLANDSRQKRQHNSTSISIHLADLLTSARVPFGAKISAKETNSLSRNKSLVHNITARIFSFSILFSPPPPRRRRLVPKPPLTERRIERKVLSDTRDVWDSAWWGLNWASSTAPWDTIDQKMNETASEALDAIESCRSSSPVNGGVNIPKMNYCFFSGRDKHDWWSLDADESRFCL